MSRREPPVCDPAGVPATTVEPVREAVAARPVGPLRAVVAIHHGYRQRNVPPSRHLGLPSPFLTLIFTLDEPLHVTRHVDPSAPPGEYRTLVGGLHTSPAVVEHDGAQSGVQLPVSPLGARALLGVPAGELVGLDVPATDVLGRVAADLHEQLRAARTWEERFRLLDDGLGRLVDSSRRPPAEVCRAWRLLHSSGGSARVAAIAHEVGWSERHLAARFRTEIGLTPKAAARVIRFDRARRMVAHANGADVAAACGYADQSHLVRDFVDFTGLGPRAWLAAEVGNLQAAPAAAGRDWSS
jgi:AraC-like DNA-binding protein